ncbi:MAG: C45 family peptidase [Bacteroidales bacterium]
MVKKVLKYILFSLLGIVGLFIGLLTYMYLSADMGEPNVKVDINKYSVTDSITYKSCNGNFIRKNKQGLWEAYLHGSPIDRGIAMGMLSKDLLYYQEKVFVDEIRTFIPSDSYLRFLKFFTVVFNRNLGEYIPQEYREEIYGISLLCTHEYDMIGTPYERQINYHAAHDIGHTMQEYMLVGCSSFAVWGNKSADSTLLVGRNFDFYVGDDFAKNRLVMFVAPSNGYKFVSIGWAGMIGVLSGMNEMGLTVTINAAKGSLPMSSAMPISLLAREILQYASTIEEAYDIAKKRHTFVSESLLIGSAKDGNAAIIEKSPSKIGLFYSADNEVICTNHYQSDIFKNDSYNMENIRMSDSPYRYKRIEQLLKNKGKIAYKDAANILRDRLGTSSEDIGLANEKSINQSIAHHSVIFKPQQGLMWVSTSPWQSGEYICYNINDIFLKEKISGEVTKLDYTIGADSIFIKNDYTKLLEYRLLVKIIKKAIKDKRVISADTMQRFIVVNPNMYYVYDLLGDYYLNVLSNTKFAKAMWNKALMREIPKVAEKNLIEEKLKKLENE